LCFYFQYGISCYPLLISFRVPRWNKQHMLLRRKKTNAKWGWVSLLFEMKHGTNSIRLPKSEGAETFDLGRLLLPRARRRPL
jgi:hypothetical protein